jgi:thiamine phosphate synthase YjbQ (UPF0047 family)
MRNTLLRVCSSTTTRAACITITRCGLKGWLRTHRSTRLARRPVAQPHRRGRLSVPDRTADAHLKRQIMGREVVVAVTDGRLDFGTWERIFSGQAVWLARES